MTTRDIQREETKKRIYDRLQINNRIEREGTNGKIILKVYFKI